MFKLGDKVVYPMQGAGIIVDKTQNKVGSKNIEYYIIKLPINNMKVMIPVDKAENLGLRHVSEIKDLEKIFDILKDKDDIDGPKNWNKRLNHNLNKIKSGNLIEIAEVARHLERLDYKKNLSSGEKKILNLAKQIIISEFVLVYDKPLIEITKLINDAIMYEYKEED